MPPKKRHTRHRRDKRRAQSWRLEVANPGRCPQCGAARAPHRICSACGFYNGQLIAPRKLKKKAEAAPEGGEQKG